MIHLGMMFVQYDHRWKGNKKGDDLRSSLYSTCSQQWRIDLLKLVEVRQVNLASKSNQFGPALATRIPAPAARKTGQSCRQSIDHMDLFDKQVETDSPREGAKRATICTMNDCGARGAALKPQKDHEMKGNPNEAPKEENCH